MSFKLSTFFMFIIGLYEIFILIIDYGINKINLFPTLMSETYMTY
nr:MAG TPA: hypothetical protein [Caudoviricetes sp.]